MLPLPIRGWLMEGLRQQYVPPIGEFTAFERTVLQALSLDFGAAIDAFLAQVRNARVIGRENTRVGFYTELEVDRSAPALMVRNPLAEGHFWAEPLARGVGILLWGRDGYLTTIEGWTVEDDELTDACIAGLEFRGSSAESH
jgi:hypothetical protein